MYDLTNFKTTDMMVCRSALRRLREEPATSMEEAAQRVVGHLFENLRIGSTEHNACALVRLYKTHRYEDLGADERSFAASLAPGLPPSTRCLTLLATRGQEPAWNDRKLSKGHKAIPLISEQLVEQTPMIARLIKQLGLPIGAVINPDRRFILDAQQQKFNVFHVADAVGSPHIPAQEEFVIPFGIRSVLGFGGVLPHGDLFATILFSKVPIAIETAELFPPLALNVKLYLLPFDSGQVFEDSKVLNA